MLSSMLPISEKPIRSSVTKNIDTQIENKFNAFKAYAEEKGLHWGFVRDKDNRLYLNNTVFAKDMSDEHWVASEEALQ